MSTLEERVTWLEERFDGMVEDATHTWELIAIMFRNYQRAIEIIAGDKDASIQGLHIVNDLLVDLAQDMQDHFKSHSNKKDTKYD